MVLIVEGLLEREGVLHREPFIKKGALGSGGGGFYGEGRNITGHFRISPNTLFCSSKMLLD